MRKFRKPYKFNTSLVNSLKSGFLYLIRDEGRQTHMREINLNFKIITARLRCKSIYIRWLNHEKIEKAFFSHFFYGRLNKLAPFKVITPEANSSMLFQSKLELLKESY